MSHKQQILEPLASISKIILLPFKSSGTKISIREHGIHYDDPQEHDIAVLNDMFVNYLDWYLINITKESTRDSFIKFAKLCKKGLEKLQYVYRKETSNVVFALQYYINLLQIILEDTERFKNVETLKKFLPNFKKDDINLVDVQSIKKIWADDEIETLFADIFACFDENLEKKNNDFTADKVKGIILTLNSKDKFFAKTIKKSLCGGAAGTISGDIDGF
jgi:hypothetical protein